MCPCYVCVCLRVPGTLAWHFFWIPGQVLLRMCHAASDVSSQALQVTFVGNSELCGMFKDCKHATGKQLASSCKRDGASVRLRHLCSGCLEGPGDSEADWGGVLWEGVPGQMAGNHCGRQAAHLHWSVWQPGGQRRVCRPRNECSVEGFGTGQQAASPICLTLCAMFIIQLQFEGRTGVEMQ